MKGEIWKEVKGYEGLYQVSNLGRIKSLPRFRRNGKSSRYKTKEKILKVGLGSTGYYFVNLCIDKQNRKPKKVHRIVANAFIPKIEGKEIINHRDGNKTNNNVSNLEWCTQQENIIHAVETGLIHKISLPKDELEELYTKQRLSLASVANIKNVSATKVESELKEKGIKLRSKSEAKTKYFITKEFLEKELKIKKQCQIASELECDPSLLSKYKKKYIL